ncbi:MAG: GNAT family N-acetyltransferase [Candidatus Aenigmarchaeota archaeon]|nr:GNAT family N-acetyltransferase [Candidatus Aenigmarchaeota archaeon]
MTVRVRAAARKDLPALGRLYARIYAGMKTSERWTVPTATSLLEHWFGAQQDLFAVAEDRNRLVGAFVTAVKPWWDGNHLEGGELFVDPVYQRQGVGRLLVREVFSRAVQKHGATVFEAVTFRTPFHRAWYASLGIQENQDLLWVSGSVPAALKKLARQ